MVNSSFDWTWTSWTFGRNKKGLFSSEHCRAGDRLYFWRSLPEPWPDLVSCKGQEGPRTVGQMKPSSESSQLCQDLGLPLSMFIQGTACCEDLFDIIFVGNVFVTSTHHVLSVRTLLCLGAPE